jgi:hypothetical protein
MPTGAPSGRGGVDSSTSLLATITVNSSSITTTMNGAPGISPFFGGGAFERLAHVAVMLVDVANAFGRQRL